MDLFLFPGSFSIMCNWLGGDMDLDQPIAVFYDVNIGDTTIIYVWNVLEKIEPVEKDPFWM